MPTSRSFFRLVVSAFLLAAPLACAPTGYLDALIARAARISETCVGEVGSQRIRIHREVLDLHKEPHDLADACEAEVAAVFPEAK